MGEIRQPTKQEREALDESIAGYDDKSKQNALFFGFYGVHAPLMARHYTSWRRGPDGRKIPNGEGGFEIEDGVTRKKPLREREWIERFVRIRDKRGNLIPLKANHTQRNFHAAVLRQERARLPVRQIVLKARKQGISTWSEAMGFTGSVREKHYKTLVIAHDDDTATEVLKMVHLMRDNTPRASGGTWQFSLKHQATYHLAWNGPMFGEMKIASAQKSDPGRGFTPSFLHLSEMAFYPDAARATQSLLNSLPKLSSTTAIIESTANGDSGVFRDRFWTAWDERELPLSERTQSWNSNFYPWFWDNDCRWSTTIGDGREPPAELLLTIAKSLTDHEKWLLEQTFFKRWSPTDEWEQVIIDRPLEGTAARKWRRKGCGWRKVDYDQLAWRRLQIRDEFNGDPLRPETWSAFQEEFPSTPEEAFRATGELVFDALLIQDRLKEACEPYWRGDLVDVAPDIVTKTMTPTELVVSIDEEKMMNVNGVHLDAR